MYFGKGTAVAEGRKPTWNVPAVFFWLATIVWCFLSGCTFVHTFPVSLTDPLKGGSCYSSSKVQPPCLVIWREGPDPEALGCHWPLNSHWLVVANSVPRLSWGRGQLSAVEACMGPCLGGCHSVWTSLHSLLLESLRNIGSQVPPRPQPLKWGLVSLLWHAFHVFQCSLLSENHYCRKCII